MNDLEKIRKLALALCVPTDIGTSALEGAEDAWDVYAETSDENIAALEQQIDRLWERATKIATALSKINEV